MRSPRCLSLRTVPGACGFTLGECWLFAALPATASRRAAGRMRSDSPGSPRAPLAPPAGQASARGQPGSRNTTCSAEQRLRVALSAPLLFTDFLYVCIYICMHKLQKQHAYAGINAVSKRKCRQLCIEFEWDFEGVFRGKKAQ